MIFIRVAASRIAIGAILLKQITWLSSCMNWILNYDPDGFIGLLGQEII
jgi:hypothetical protein